MSDDVGWSEFGFNGGPAGRTPNLDRLADQGVVLTQFYVYSVCSPTRATFLTGRYAFRTWMDWRSEDFGKPSYLDRLGLSLPTSGQGKPTRRIHALDTREQTIAEALQECGYFTAIAGKWHCGEWLPEHLPLRQGFLHQYGHYGWGVDYHRHTIPHNAPARLAVYDWHRNQRPIHEPGYTTDLIAAEVERIIARQRPDRPFFIYVPFNAIHGPIKDVPRYSETYGPRGAALKCLDDAVATILNAIERHQFLDNTLVVFTNDNGGPDEELNRPLRGGKNTTLEGAVHVPCLLRWPGRLKPGSRDGLMFIADFFPTFITLAGASPERPGRPGRIDGIDMTAMLFDGAASDRKEIVFEVAGSVRPATIRSGDYKLIGDQLYDLAADPGETMDVAANHPDVVQELSSRLAEFGRQRPPLGDKPMLMDPALPYVYGRQENVSPPDWLTALVDAVRIDQPRQRRPGQRLWMPAPRADAPAPRADAPRPAERSPQ